MSESSVIPSLDDPNASSRRTFTLDEANRSLPYVSRVALDITEVYSRILELRRELENLDECDLRDLTEREYDQTMDRLGGLVDELHEVGAELRDFELGRIEFPARFQQCDVMLSWQLDEPAVNTWRRLEGDDGNLHPVAELTRLHAA